MGYSSWGLKESDMTERLSTCVFGFPSGSVVKSPPANTGNLVQSLGQENPTEMKMATHSSILSWRSPCTEAIVHGVAKSRT